MSRYEGYAIGIRMKSNPQSLIHLICSSVVVPRDDAGFGEKKSRRLKPLHRGSLLAGAELDNASDAVSGSVRAAPASAVFLRTVLLFMAKGVDVLREGFL